ncbi:MAG TPA: hypothetical protein ACHBX0_10920 [Arsenophonus sp.]
MNKKARERYEKSVDLGSLNNLAQFYEKGYGVKKNSAYAIELYRRAAYSSDAIAHIIWGLFMMQESI